VLPGARGRVVGSGPGGHPDPDRRAEGTGDTEAGEPCLEPSAALEGSHASTVRPLPVANL